MSLPEEERDGEGIHGCDKCCWRDDKFEEETERLRKIVEYYEMMIQ